MLVLDALNLASAGSHPASPARTAALAFVNALNSGDGASLLELLAALCDRLMQGVLGKSPTAATSTFGGASAGTGSIALATVPVVASAAVMTGGGTGAAICGVVGERERAATAKAKAEQLKLTCLCLFYGCLREGDSAPPPAFASSLVSLLRRAAENGVPDVFDLLFLALLTLIAPPPPTAISTAPTVPRRPLPQPHRAALSPILSDWSRAVAVAQPPAAGTQFAGGLRAA